MEAMIPAEPIGETFESSAEKLPNRATRRKAAATARQRGKTLDRLNEKLASRNLHLHPTRGYRTISPFRTVVEEITEARRRGFGLGTDTMREMLQEARS